MSAAGPSDNMVSYRGESVTKKALLERYNPVLVILPNETTFNRPGSWWRGRGRGDYHPCSAEFFISQLAWYRQRRGILRKRSKKVPEEPGFIRDKVVQANGDTGAWEIDLAPFGSGDAKKAWRVYGELLKKDGEARRCVTYGRCRQSGGRIALQYWYLYLYNDAGNTHEGDWETVTLELDPSSGPTRVGYSGHEGGARRTWEGVTRQGEKPLVYVARGSHAAYLDHMPLGHKTAHLNFEKGLPRFLQATVTLVENVLMKLLYFWGVRDYTSSIDDEGDGNQGRLTYPEVLEMPEIAEVTDGDWWWMKLNCPWGSSHARFRDFRAPDPPWMKPDKWRDPLAWLSKQPVR